VLVEIVDDDLRIGVALEFDDERQCSSDSLRIAEMSVMTFSLTRFGDLLLEAQRG
jgi:hypothetical protein